jgi:hypothetical protein
MWLRSSSWMRTCRWPRASSPGRSRCTTRASAGSTRTRSAAKWHCCCAPATQELGYFDLDLHYGGFAMAAPDAARLRAIAADPTAELLYDEVDAGDSGFEHRLLFSREREVAIRFADLGLWLASRPSRAFERGVDRFEGC